LRALPLVGRSTAPVSLVAFQEWRGRAGEKRARSLSDSGRDGVGRGGASGSVYLRRSADTLRA
jgi:hypothetical protein